MIHLILVLLSAPALCYGIMFKCFLIGNIIHFLQHGNFSDWHPKVGRVHVLAGRL